MEKIIEKHDAIKRRPKVASRLLFLTGLYPMDRLEEIRADSIGGLDNAANALQWKYVKGFDALGLDQTIINAPYVGSYPRRYRKMWFRSQKFSHNTKANDYSVGFCNLGVIKKIHRMMRMQAELRRQLRSDVDTPCIVAAYAMTGSNLSLLRTAKQQRPSIKTMLIVPDLPEFMNTSNSSGAIYTFFKKIEMFYIRLNFRFVDRFVLLTEAMSELYDFKDRYVVSEGIANESQYTVIPDSNMFTIAYTGTLNERYGIRDLLDGFMLTEIEGAKLIICGDGDSKGYVEECALSDKRIIYRGATLPDEALEIQRQSDVLINPRMNNEEFVKYSFPSKILEYMSAGRVVLSYKLSSFTDKYDKYLDYIQGPTANPAENIARAINDIYTMPKAERIKRGRNNYLFTQKNLSAKSVTKRIIKGLM